MRPAFYIGLVCLALLQLALVTPDPTAAPSTAAAMSDDSIDDDDDDVVFVASAVLTAPLASAQPAPDASASSNAIFRDVISRLDRPPRA